MGLVARWLMLSSALAVVGAFLPLSPRVLSNPVHKYRNFKYSIPPKALSRNMVMHSTPRSSIGVNHRKRRPRSNMKSNLHLVPSSKPTSQNKLGTMLTPILSKMTKVLSPKLVLAAAGALTIGILFYHHEAQLCLSYGAALADCDITKMRTEHAKVKGILGKFVRRDKLLLSFMRCYFGGQQEVETMGLRGESVKVVKRVINLNLISDEQAVKVFMVMVDELEPSRLLSLAVIAECLIEESLLRDLNKMILAKCVLGIDELRHVTVNDRELVYQRAKRRLVDRSVRRFVTEKSGGSGSQSSASDDLKVLEECRLLGVSEERLNRELLHRTTELAGSEKSLWEGELGPYVVSLQSRDKEVDSPANEMDQSESSSSNVHKQSINHLSDEKKKKKKIRKNEVLDEVLDDSELANLENPLSFKERDIYDRKTHEASKQSHRQGMCDDESASCWFVKEEGRKPKAIQYGSVPIKITEEGRGQLLTCEDCSYSRYVMADVDDDDDDAEKHPIQCSRCGGKLLAPELDIDDGSNAVGAVNAPSVLNQSYEVLYSTESI